MKGGKHVYEQKGGLWFLFTPHMATEHVKARLHKAEKEQAALAKQQPAAATGQR